jgi:hypothetical protein
VLWIGGIETAFDVKVDRMVSGGVTIGPATVAPGTTEFESPWPFGPLGSS